MWAVLDLETTIKSYAKRKASPFHPENWVVMGGWATKADPTPRGRRYAQFRQGDLTDDFISLLTSGIRLDRKSTRLNSSHEFVSRMPSSA